MKYKLSDKRETEEAYVYLAKLIIDGSMVEIKKISPRRSINQNNYLHLLLGAFGNHFGYNLEEAKEIYKDLNKGVYAYEKKGRTFHRSSADLTKEEMAKTIDLFMRTSAEFGFTLPAATDQEWLRRISNDMEKSRYYL